MRKGSGTWRAVTAGLLATGIAALGAATAHAQTVTATDGSAAQFAQGTTSGTVVHQVLEDGTVSLVPTVDAPFDGDVLPSGWTAVPWDTGGSAAVAGGALTVDGARVDSGVPAGPGSSLEFRATLGDQPNRHVGFAADFASPPWAMFSTGTDGGGKVYARASDGALPGSSDIELAGVDATEPHDYRIDWTDNGFDFSVDGTLLTTQSVPLTAAMDPQISDFDPSGGALSVDSLTLLPYAPASGSFVSRVLDAGDARVEGASLMPTSTTPAGTDIAYETRSGATADAATHAAWAPLGAGGEVASPARFLQYRATLSTTANATPVLDEVTAFFTIDDQAPAVTIAGVSVSGDIASATFSSNDPSANLACRLDGAAFDACGSPTAFGRLAPGSHTLTVQATDAYGNVGAASRTFAVAAPPAPGGTGDSGTAPPQDGGTTPPDQGTTPPAVTPPAPPGPTPPPVPRDRTAPKVHLTQASPRLTRQGSARIRIACPSTEKRCAVAVTLQLSGKEIARRTLMVAGGSTRTVDLPLSKAVRARLAAHSALKVTAVVAAQDAAGNRKTTRVGLTLRAAARR